MKTAAAPFPVSRFQGRFLALALLALVVILGGFFAFRTPRAAIVSNEMLAEKYGLHVNLVAVTAAGGLVDVRLKVIDAGKASLLLQDKKNFPALYVADSGITIRLPVASRPEISLEDDGNLYVLYPNARNAVKPGTPVTIRFGNLNLEPIPAK
jgi:hypothetical protein